MSSKSEQPSAECKHCGTTLSGDDPTYRVLYRRFEHAHDGVVSDKLVAGPNETLDPARTSDTTVSSATKSTTKPARRYQ